MCNKLHKGETFHLIPPSAVGWKIFRKTNNNKFIGMVAETYLLEEDEWIRWTNTLHYEWSKHPDAEYGFCAFPSLIEALDALKEWKTEIGKWDPLTNYEVRKIEYNYGIGMFDSLEFDGTPRRFILFKNFRIIPRKKEL